MGPDDELIYDTGYELGRLWARGSATPAQLRQIREFGDGRLWATGRPEPAVAFARLLGPGTERPSGANSRPAPAFLAGFINGARATDLLT